MLDVSVMPTVPVSVTTIAQVVIDRDIPDRMTWLQVKAGGRRGFVAQLVYTHTPNGCKPDWYALEELLDTILTQQALNGDRILLR